MIVLGISVHEEQDDVPYDGTPNISAFESRQHSFPSLVNSMIEALLTTSAAWNDAVNVLGSSNFKCLLQDLFFPLRSFRFTSFKIIHASRRKLSLMFTYLPHPQCSFSSSILLSTAVQLQTPNPQYSIFAIPNMPRNDIEVESQFAELALSEPSSHIEAEDDAHG